MLMTWAMLCSVGWTETTAPASDEEIGRLITQLGDENYHQREAATAKLKAIGRPALPQLKMAESHSDPEVRVRAIELARAIEAPPVSRAIDNVGRREQLAHRQAMELVLNRDAALHVQQHLSFVVDGIKYNVVKKTNNDVTSIRVDVTETKDGKTLTRTVEAASEEDLVKKDPALAQVVKKQLGNAPIHPLVGIQLGGQVFVGGGAVVALQPVPPAQPAEADLAFGARVAPHDEGMRVTAVKENSVAEKLGLQEGDLITKINDRFVRTIQDAIVAGIKAIHGNSLEIELLRDGKTITLKQ